MVQVVDACPSCAANQLVLHYLTFNHYIASGTLGQANITYQQVRFWNW